MEIHSILLSTQMQSADEVPTPRVPIFWGGMVLFVGVRAPPCSPVKRDALAVSQVHFGEPGWRSLVWCLSQRHASLKYVLSSKTVSSRHPWDNRKVMGEPKAGLLVFLYCFFMIKYSLGEAPQCKVLNRWAGRNLRIHGHSLISWRNQLKQIKIICPRPHSWWCAEVENRTQVFVPLGYSFSPYIYNALTLGEEDSAQAIENNMFWLASTFQEPYLFLLYTCSPLILKTKCSLMLPSIGEFITWNSEGLNDLPKAMQLVSRGRDSRLTPTERSQSWFLEIVKHWAGRKAWEETVEDTPSNWLTHPLFCK